MSPQARGPGEQGVEDSQVARQREPHRGPRVHPSTVVAGLFVAAWIAGYGLGGNGVGAIKGAVVQALNTATGAPGSPAPPSSRDGGGAATLSRQGSEISVSPSVSSPVGPTLGGHGTTAGAPGAAGPPAAATPTAPSTASRPPTVDPGSYVTVQQSTVYSATGSITGSGPFTGIVNYGDGTGDQPLVIQDQAFSLSHPFTQAGTFSVVIQVSDAFGRVGTGFTEVTVKSALPGIG